VRLETVERIGIEIALTARLIVFIDRALRCIAIESQFIAERLHVPHRHGRLVRADATRPVFNRINLVVENAKRDTLLLLRNCARRVS
jgi:hypothetical protein